jgi:hypothetical protein
MNAFINKLYNGPGDYSAKYESMHPSDNHLMHHGMHVYKASKSNQWRGIYYTSAADLQFMLKFHV